MKKIFVSILVLVLVLVGGVGIDQIFAAQSGEGVIPSTVYIEGVNVSGLTEAEANSAIDDILNKYASSQITLTTSCGSVSVTAGELGLAVKENDVVKEALSLGKEGSLLKRYKAKKDLENTPVSYELEFSVNDNLILAAITSHEEEITAEPIDSALERVDGAFNVIEGQNGVSVNLSESVANVRDYFENSWAKEDATIALDEVIDYPDVTPEQLARVKDLIGSFHTDFSSSAAGRYKNVVNGCSKINGSIIYPGEQFSVYRAVSPFEPENGYELAGSYENGQTVQTYGGGICQVSTTLYNAIIRSELQIDERFCHSMIVSYVKPSMDAAISGTAKDFKFTNNTDAPVYIEGYCSGGVIYFNVFGEETRPENRKIAFESVTLSTTEAGVSVVGDPTLPVGQVATSAAHTGYTAELYKVVYEDDIEVSREKFNSSRYNPSNRTVRVGTATGDPTAAAQIAAAVNTQNEGLCRAVAACLAVGDYASAQYYINGGQ